MAAPAGLPLVQVVELAELSGSDLDPLLAEETEVWRERLHWDFRPSADLLHRLLQIRSLYGNAVRIGREIVGYAYYVSEGHKGLIGDFFVRPAYTTPSIEAELLRAVVESLLRNHGIRRIESQLMMLRNLGTVPLPSVGRKVSRHERFFMEVEQGPLRRLPHLDVRFSVRFVPWAERYMEEMAHLLAACYRGHIDSELNDQYRTLSGARQFLSNIIRFPGCGRFSPETSLLAVDTTTGRLAGMCLASRVSEVAGHITQVCVLPALRGRCLGYELIRLAANKLVTSESHLVSLTVTCDNVAAVGLYSRLGFQIRSTFPALVWDRA